MTTNIVDDAVVKKGTLENAPLEYTVTTGMVGIHVEPRDVVFGSFGEGAAGGDFITETLWGSLRRLSED
ncbi:MAG TPA: hypothetical protein VGS09_03275 [Actinomycetota bacterium]|jgi:hypothetical protein|nr:hypothetical protein [Actinomycetota bacterium]